VDLNAAYYVPGLLRDVDYVVTSAGVRGRFEAQPERFPMQVRFYRWLDRHADRVATFVSGAHVEGPEIRIYRLGERAWAGLKGVDIGRSWWRTGSAGGERHDDTGESASDLAIYGRWYAPFLRDLIAEHRALGHCGRVLGLASLQLEMVPEDMQTILAYLQCARLEGAWSEARGVAERVLPVVAAREGGIPPEIMLEYADVLAHTGEVDRARRGWRRLAATATGEVAQEARRRLSRIEGARSQSAP
jgi:hypothetical protein